MARGIEESALSATKSTGFILRNPREARARVELMSNHYHLLVETPEANVVAGMRWLQNTYTRRHKIC
jgi:hypothetical protein